MDEFCVCCGNESKYSIELALGPTRKGSLPFPAIIFPISTLVIRNSPPESNRLLFVQTA